MRNILNDTLLYLYLTQQYNILIEFASCVFRVQVIVQVVLLQRVIKVVNIVLSAYPTSV